MFSLQVIIAARTSKNADELVKQKIHPHQLLVAIDLLASKIITFRKILLLFDVIVESVFFKFSS